MSSKDSRRKKKLAERNKRQMERWLEQRRSRRPGNGDRPLIETSPGWGLLPLPPMTVRSPWPLACCPSCLYLNVYPKMTEDEVWAKAARQQVWAGRIPDGVLMSDGKPMSGWLLISTSPTCDCGTPACVQNEQNNVFEALDAAGKIVGEPIISPGWDGPFLPDYRTDDAAHPAPE